MKRFTIFLGLSLLVAASALGNTLPVVSTGRAIQQPNSALVNVPYEVFDADGDLVNVTLWYSLDGGVTWDNQCITVWGDVGVGVAPGTGLNATWDAGTDAVDIVDPMFALRVYADDSGGGGAPDGFVLIPPGTFQMGSPAEALGRYADETLHTVTLTQGFYIATTEVTEQWWDEVMGSGSSTSQLPKALVSWDSCVAFCNQLSLNEGLTPAYTINGPYGDVTWSRAANGYRLPTEAEWEYACRAGNQAAFCNGPIVNEYFLCSPLEPYLDLVGWYCGNAEGIPHEVGQKSANAWGVFDMHGNLNEFVWDGYRADYQNLPAVDPVYDVGLNGNRGVRSGNWSYHPNMVRSARRKYTNAYQPAISIGFRPARSAF